MRRLDDEFGGSKMKVKVIVPCVIISIVAMALIVDLDYGRYGQRVIEAVESSIDTISVEIDNSPKIKVNTGCADLLDQRVWLQEQWDNGIGDLPAGETIEFYEEIKELNKKYLEAKCTDTFINGEIVK